MVLARQTFPAFLCHFGAALFAGSETLPARHYSGPEPVWKVVLANTSVSVFLLLATISAFHLVSWLAEQI